MEVTDHRQRRAALFSCALASSLSLAGCTEDARSELDLAEANALHLGRVHLVVEPNVDDTTETEPFLDVTARFAYFRGLEEDFVRARIDMPVLAPDVLRRSQCVPSEQLAAADTGLRSDSDLRELVLLDAGNLTVELGDTNFDVPLSLWPDLLPYMSGVEYLYYGEVPTVMAEGAAIPVAVSADGSQNGEITAFTIEGQIPIPLELSSTETDVAELQEDALVIRWQPAGDADENVVLELAAFVGAEPAGSEMTCLFADVGTARISLGALRTQGLGASGDNLRVSASRMHRSSFDAGELIGGELVVEIRDQVDLALP